DAMANYQAQQQALARQQASNNFHRQAHQASVAQAHAQAERIRESLIVCPFLASAIAYRWPKLVAVATAQHAPHSPWFIAKPKCFLSFPPNPMLFLDFSSNQLK
ncbi:MAG: hypothetical protein MKZ63_08460, partial [Nitrospinales bacterium]|nr:hypothetical protein [Nitrospinales bacterium]